MICWDKVSTGVRQNSLSVQDHNEKSQNAKKVKWWSDLNGALRREHNIISLEE